jgi:hypothetical protein
MDLLLLSQIMLVMICIVSEKAAAHFQDHFTFVKFLQV